MGKSSNDETNDPEGQGDVPTVDYGSVALGQSAQIGRYKLQSGMFVNIIVVKGNPLEDSRMFESVMFMMKGGVIYKRILMLFYLVLKIFQENKASLL